MKRSIEIMRRTCCVVVLVLSPAVRICTAQQLLFELKGDNAAGRAPDDGFGLVCVGVGDLDGDSVPELCIGAHRYNTTVTRLEGAAFVFSGATGSIIRKHIGPSRDGQLGRSLDGGVDLDGDGIDDYVLGEPFGDLTATDAGTVHVHSGATGALLWAFGGERAFDRLGESVALIEDVDGDGCGEIVATAFLWDNNQVGTTQCGRGYCWSGRTGQILWTIDGYDQDQWLYWCSWLEDWNLDGVGDVAFGSIGTGAPGNGAGKVEVVSGRDGSLIVTLPGGAPHDAFGLVRATGDVDGDDVGDLLVGAMNANNDLGLIDVISGSTFTVIRRHDGIQKGESLTSGALRAVFDWNDDGFDDELFGSTARDCLDCKGGIAVLVSGRTGRTLFEYRSREDLGLGPTLGHSCSMVGDLNGDGIPEIVVGAPGAGPAFAADGRVYVFAGDDLFLQADQSDYDDGDPIAIELRGGAPGVLGLIAVTAIDGVPLFAPLVVGPLDGNGELAFHDTTDPAYLGFEVELTGWCQRPTGRGAIDSNLERIRF